MDYELIEKQVLYDGDRLRLELHHLLSEGIRHKKEVVVHRGSVVVLPVMGDGKILLIRNRRYALGQVLVELPAGTLERNEDPMNAAGRELLEETGYLPRRLKAMASFYASPGILTEKMHVFIAYDLEKREQDLDVGEEIQLLPTEIGEAIRMIRNGEIIDGKTIAALMCYERFHLR